MKKLAILSITFLFAVSVLHGQTQTPDKAKTKEVKKEQKAERVALKKLEGTVVNEKAKSNFMVAFPDATNAQWKRVNTYDEVAFTKAGHQMKGYYDIDGNLVGTTEFKTYADLPVKGQNEIKTRYPGYTPGQVIFYDDNEANETDMIMYGIQFDDVDSYFVELSKGTRKIAVQVLMDGEVKFFTADLK
ncbi:MAG: hypothetical protein WA816_13210 [Bacteroidales bacterium]